MPKPYAETLCLNWYLNRDLPDAGTTWTGQCTETRYVYDDVTYVYDDVTYVYDDVTCVLIDTTWTGQCTKTRYALSRTHSIENTFYREPIVRWGHKLDSPVHPRHIASQKRPTTPQMRPTTH